MSIRAIRPRSELEFNLVRKLIVGPRHEVHVSAVSSPTGQSVAIQNFVERIEGPGLKPAGRVFVFRQHITEIIEALSAAQAVIDALPPIPDTSERPSQ